MHHYVTKAFQQFDHSTPSTPQPLIDRGATPQYGDKCQLTLPLDNTTSLTVTQDTQLQQVFGTFIYYIQAVYRTLLITMIYLASAQGKATTATLQHINQFLNYASTPPASDSTLLYMTLKEFKDKDLALYERLLDSVLGFLDWIYG
jgi:hypothetical protein